MEIKARYIVLGPDETLDDVDRYVQVGQTTTLADLDKANASDYQRALRRDSLTLQDLRAELAEILEPLASETGHEGLSAMYRFLDAHDAKRQECPFSLEPNGSDKLEDIPYRWISVFPVTGTNEGHYIHVDLIWQANYREGRVCLFLLKTFGGHEAAVKLAGILCRVLGV